MSLSALRALGSKMDSPASVEAAIERAELLVARGYLRPDELGDADVIGAANEAAVRSGVIRSPGEFDQRFEKRVKEQDRIAGMEIDIDALPRLNVPEIPLSQFEGRPYVTSMSDRTSAEGTLRGINGVEFEGVPLQGGQDYMFRNPGQVWASGSGIVPRLMNGARAGGEDSALFLPFRMSPEGGDYAMKTNMTMVNYNRANMNKRQKRDANKKIKERYKDFPGIDDPQVESWIGSLNGPRRKRFFLDMDLMRNDGGLGRGEARVAVADDAQLTAKDYRLQNVGLVDTRGELIRDSGHITYATGLPGEGLGRIKDAENISPFDLDPRSATTGKSITAEDNLNPTDVEGYTLRQQPEASGVITEDVLRRLQARGVEVGNADPRLLAGIAGGTAAATGLLASDDSEAAVVPSVRRGLLNTLETDRAVSEGRATMLGSEGRTFADPETETVARLYDDLRAQKSESGVSTYDEIEVGDAPGISSQGASPIARYRLPQEYADSLGQAGRSSPDLIEVQPDGSGASAFHGAISDAKNKNKYGASVYVYPEEDYSGMRLFMTEDGSAGYALKPDGDVVSAFSSGNHPGVAQNLLLHSIEQGGQKLDAFDTVLPDLYATMGFREDARVKWDDGEAPDDWSKETFAAFNSGEPDVSLMSYRDAPASPVEERMVGDYGEAMDAQAEGVASNAARRPPSREQQLMDRLSAEDSEISDLTRKRDYLEDQAFMAGDGDLANDLMGRAQSVDEKLARRQKVAAGGGMAGLLAGIEAEAEESGNLPKQATAMGMDMLTEFLSASAQDVASIAAGVGASIIPGGRTGRESRDSVAEGDWYKGGTVGAAEATEAVMGLLGALPMEEISNFYSNQLIPSLENAFGKTATDIGESLGILGLTVGAPGSRRASGLLD